ncbi:transposase, partial [Bacteroides uniformis]
DMSNRSKEAYKDENAQLKKRIKELEKALSFSKLETEARELMITRAEELFNIPIRKKSGAKS